jgi:predicted O-methyltransferase YrrM
MQRVNLIFQYLSYKLFARHKHGQGIHSPFVYGLITKVLDRNEKFPVFQKIEKIRKQYLLSDEPVIIKGHGAGSRTSKKNIRKLKEIVRTSAVSAKYGRMLYHLVTFYQPQIIAELGTSTGISTAYLALAAANTKVLTVEGNSSLAQIARNTFHELNIGNTEQITGTFNDALHYIIQCFAGKVLVFIDGDHRFESIMGYFQRILCYHGECLVIIDDIRWSEDMLKAWKKIISDSSVQISIDIFNMGIVLLNKNTQKCHFVIRF